MSPYSEQLVFNELFRADPAHKIARLCPLLSETLGIQGNYVEISGVLHQFKQRRAALLFVSGFWVSSCFWQAPCRHKPEDVRTWPRSKHRSLFQAFVGNEIQSKAVSPWAVAPAMGPCSGLQPACSAVIKLIYKLRWSHNPGLIYRLKGAFAPNPEAHLLLRWRCTHHVCV